MAKRHVPPAVRAYVYWRDNHRCRKCKTEGGKHNRLTLHHINHQHGGEHDRPENLEVLCQRCHTALHKRWG